jgi:uncharacterized protein YggE
MSEAPIVAVRGEVDREVPPEIATVTVTVAARDRDREVTLRRLAERAAALGELLDRYGDAIERRETGGIYVYPETGRAGERVVAYSGSVTTQLTVAEFEVLGELVLRLADQDQTTVAGPWWALRPNSPAYRQARHDAIADALVRAREYAEALGARVERLVELADSGLSRGEPPTPLPRQGIRLLAQAEGEPAPELDLEPRLQRVYAAVEARFAISEPNALAG